MTFYKNTTENNFPFNKDDTLKDSQVSFDPVNNILIVTIPVIFPRGITFVVDTYTILLTDDIIEATTGTFSVFLPAIPSVMGEPHTTTNSGAGVITLDGNGNNINGVATRTLATDESAAAVWNGTEWRVV